MSRSIGAAAGVVLLAVVQLVLMAGCACNRCEGSKGGPDVRTREIVYECDGVSLRGMMAWDERRTGKRPGVLVCHEWWGNNEYSARRATQLAEAGYVALALDMYGTGKVTTDPEQAKTWSGELYGDTGVLRRRVAAAMRVLCAEPRVDRHRLAAIGYCMGGTVALELARSGEAGGELRAVVCFHTSNLAAKDEKDNANIKAEVLLCTGLADGFVPPEAVAEFERRMREAGVRHRVIGYPGAKHSFTNPESDGWGFDAAGYNAEADSASYAEMRALFSRVLDR